MQLDREETDIKKGHFLAHPIEHLQDIQNRRSVSITYSRNYRPIKFALLYDEEHVICTGKWQLPGSLV